MMRLFCMLSAIAVAMPAVAEPPADVARENCAVLVAYFHNPKLLRSDVALFLDGLFVGVQASTGLAPDAIRPQIVETCQQDPDLQDPAKQVYWVIRAAVMGAQD